VAVVVISLGLSLGIACTTFAILDAVVHPHVPYREPDRLFSVAQWGDGASHEVGWWEKYLEVRDRAGIHDGVALYTYGYWGDLTGPAATVRTSVLRVSANFFDLLGVRPVQGRLFRPGGSDAADAPQIVVSEEFWRQAFGEREFLGAAVTVGDATFEVIGVAPAGMSLGGAWILLPTSVAETGSGTRIARPIVRLREGMSLEQAKQALARAAIRLRREHGMGEDDFAYRLYSVIPDPLRFKRFHAAMAGGAITILLIACGNLVNMMLARGVARRRDVALQMALGAGRHRVMRQVLWEVGLLGVGGGVLGALLAMWGIEILVHSLPPEIRFIGIFQPHLSWRVFLFGLVTTVIAMTLSGALPAAAASRIDPSEPLQDHAGTTTGRVTRSYNPLVITAVAGSIVLLMGAGLLFKAARRVSDYDFGFDPTGLLSVRAWLPAEQRGTPEGHATVGRLMDRLETIPEVDAVAWTSAVIPDKAGVLSDHNRRFLNLRTYRTVSSGFLGTLGIPVMRGRDFTVGDESGSGLVIVDEDAARELWPGIDPVGRMIKLGGIDAAEKWYPVIGVARSASLFFEEDPYLEPQPNVFLLPSAYGGRSVQLVVRVGDDEPRVSAEIKRTLTDLIPGSGMPFVFPWLGYFNDMVDAREFMAGLFGLFGLFALFLSSMGLNAVLSYAVGRRMREFGVRIALGAKRPDILRLVLREGAVLILGGVAIGAVVAMWSAQLLTHWLYDINPTDVVALVGAELVLIVVSLIACAVPGLRATKADPLEILRAT
jgi:predicted permease